MDANTKDTLTLVLPIAIGAAGVAFASWMTFQNNKLSTKMDVTLERVNEANARVEAVGVDVLKVEKATNSHTDLLVAAKVAASHAEGKEQERVEQRERTSQQAVGAAQATTAAVPPATTP